MVIIFKYIFGIVQSENLILFVHKGVFVLIYIYFYIYRVCVYTHISIE